MERTREPHLKLNLDVSTRLALEIFSTGSYLSINKKLLIHYGPEIAIYISNLIEKYKYFIKREKIKNDWFYLIHDHQIEQTGLTITKIRTCKKVLKKRHILRTKMKGFPPKEYFQINFSELLGIIGSYHSSGNLTLIHQETLPSFIRKPYDNTFNILNKNKNNNKEKIFTDLFPDEWKRNKTFISTIKDYIQYRSQKGKALTELSCIRLYNKLIKVDIITAIKAIDRSIENGWTGVFPDAEKEYSSNKKDENDYDPYDNEEPLADKFTKR
jgi:hypothetical protein